MFIDLAAKPLFGAPAERNVREDEYDEPYISLRWSEQPFRMEESINIRSLRDWAI
jgi:hypothetical protein